MSSEKTIDALDQSRDVIAVQAVLAAGNLKAGAADREILRRLAAEAAELATRPIEAEKREL